MKKYLFVRGRVIHGDRLGRKIGFPTANLRVSSKKRIPSGVYIVLVMIGKRKKMYQGLLHVGPRKTLSETTSRIEVFLLSFRGRLYGKTLLLYILKRLRGIRTFASFPALQHHIQRDCLAAHRFFTRHASLFSSHHS